MLAVPTAAEAGPSDATAVIVAKWRGVPRAAFLASYVAVSDGTVAQRAGNTGMLATWSEDLREGMIIAQWLDERSARAFLKSEAVSRLREAGGTPPSEVSVVVARVA